MDKNVTYELVARYFTGNCNAEEKQLVEDWRDATPDNMEAFAQYRAIWKNARQPEKAFSPNVESALGKVNKQLTSNSERKPGKVLSLARYTLRIAAAVTIGIGLWLAYTLLWNKQAGTLLVAESGNAKKEVILSDSTHIWLNKNSMLRYPETFNGKERKVYIEGEAYFDVAKNPSMPFVIETNQSVVTVLGTEFNLRARKNEALTVVSVTEGKVSFAGKQSQTSKPVYLMAGDKGLLNSSINELDVEKTTDPNLLAWKTGKLVFNNTPLDKVAADLSAYFDTTITVESDAKKEIPFTSTFDNQKLGDILQIMELSLGVRADSTSGSIQLK